ncbi:hydroxymethylbilane synthase [Nonomuraea sp. NPDC046802]|uniref:hydroxymethylbilane synthase n=1 Tax=Nonomuraea sp. NPDC046802 TaxID=3154919 RepID=UPI0033F748FA
MIDDFPYLVGELTGSPLRLGTRASRMAIAQADTVAHALRFGVGREVEIVKITAAGDAPAAPHGRQSDSSVFVTALREQVLRGDIDVAVHSLKDLPSTSTDPRLTVAAVPRRDDPRDALVAGARLDELPAGARVGTSSARRVAMLRALRPDLTYVPIRGNIETRIGHIIAGTVDAVVLALAGLRRIGRIAEIAQIFAIDELLPAPGQGAVAIECLTERTDLRHTLGRLTDARTRTAITAERDVLAYLRVGRTDPVGAYAADDGHLLTLTAALASPDGRWARATGTCDSWNATHLSFELATDLLTQLHDSGPRHASAET